MIHRVDWNFWLPILVNADIAFKVFERSNLSEEILKRILKINIPFVIISIHEEKITKHNIYQYSTYEHFKILLLPHTTIGLLTSYEKTFPVVATVTKWEFLVSVLYSTGQWNSSLAFLWKFSFIKLLASKG